MLRSYEDRVVLKINGDVVLDVPVDYAVKLSVYFGKPWIASMVLCKDSKIDLNIERKYFRFGLSFWLTKFSYWRFLRKLK